MLGVDRRKALGVEAGQHRVARAAAALHVLRVRSAAEHHGEHDDFVDAMRTLARDLGGEVAVAAAFVFGARARGAEPGGGVLASPGDRAEGVLPQPGIDVLLREALLDSGLVGRRPCALERCLAQEQRARAEQDRGNERIARQARLRFLVHAEPGGSTQRRRRRGDQRPSYAG